MYGHQDQPAKGRGRGRGRRRDEHSSPPHIPGAMKDRMEPEQMPQDVRSSDNVKQPEQKQQRPFRLGAKGRARPRRPEQQLYVPRALRNKEDNSQTPVPNSKRTEKQKENQRTEEAHLERNHNSEENRVASREGSGLMQCKEAAHTCSAMDTDTASSSSEKETVHATFAEYTKTVCNSTPSSRETVLSSSATEREAAHTTSAINSIPAQTPATQETLCSEVITAEHAAYGEYSQQDEGMAESVSCDTVSKEDNRDEAAVCSEQLTEDSGEHTMPAEATEQLENVGETDKLQVHTSDSNVQVEELSLESAEDKEDPTSDTHKRDSSARVEELSSESAEDKEDPTSESGECGQKVCDRVSPIVFCESTELKPVPESAGDASLMEVSSDRNTPGLSCESRGLGTSPERDSHSPGVFGENKELRTLSEGAQQAPHMPMSSDLDSPVVSCENEGLGTSSECTLSETPHREVSQDMDSSSASCDIKELRTVHGGAGDEPHMEESLVMDSSSASCGKLGTSPGDVGDAPRMEMSPERLSETSGSSHGSEEEDDEDSWDRLYDDNGDCLDPSVMEQLSSFVGEVEVSKPKKTINYLEFSPKEPDLDLSAYSHVIEISDFPVSFKTEDLLVSFKQYMNRGFDIKWVDDTHALGIFSSTVAANDALQMIHPMLKVKPLSEASRLSRQKAKRCQEFLQPFKPRPQTSAAAARRLVTGALGLAPRMTKEKRDEERRVLKEAREKKRMDRKRKDDIWNGEIGKCAMDSC